MIFAADDGNVVVMYRRLSLDQYLGGPESVRPQELRYGRVRQPPAPGFHHQIVVGRIFARLDRHVRRYNAGRVVISPVDVILDMTHALVVQPDLVFVSTARLAICTDRIWGGPDLTIEVLSKANRHHDCHAKVNWYRQYGVHECWLVDPDACRIEVIDLASEAGRWAVEKQQLLRSKVLPRLRLRVGDALSD